MDVLAFPWSGEHETLKLENAVGRRLAHPVSSSEDSPPFHRSTRDGYALSSAECYGASPSNPAFLTVCGEVPMGTLPSFSIGNGECALIHTGGILPEGSDAVVMTENAERSGKWVEIRSAVQSGENIVFKGEEFSANTPLLKQGTLVDFRSAGLLASAGVSYVDVFRIKIGIISTGDEIVPCDTQELLPGQFRDVNAHLLFSLLEREGFFPVYYGIAGDSQEALSRMTNRALEESSVVLLSGGSSVSTRDYCSTLLESLPEPGLLIRGILMSPGKPTLIAGMKRERKLVMGLPGHPFSCFLAAYTILLPLLNAMCTGNTSGPWKSLLLPSAESIFGHSGIEEFLPCVIENGRAVPLPVKSSFAKALSRADGLFRLSASRETVRPQEEVEVWLW